MASINASDRSKPSELNYSRRREAPDFVVNKAKNAATDCATHSKKKIGRDGSFFTPFSPENLRLSLVAGAVIGIPYGLYRGLYGTKKQPAVQRAVPIQSAGPYHEIPQPGSLTPRRLEVKVPFQPRSAW
jgi:hypothetical protein